MSGKNKSKELIPLIQKATTKDEAIKVLYEVLDALHMTSSYTEMVALKDKLGEYKDEYKKITSAYEKSDQSYKETDNTRGQLNFLMVNLTDELSFQVNKTKIYYENLRTQIRSESIQDIGQDEVLKKTMNVKSISAIEKIYGIQDSYKEYVVNYSMAYGIYKDLGNLLESIKLFTDLLASRISMERVILMKDQK